VIPAHGRRDFFDLARLAKAPIAKEIVRRIDEVFAIERHQRQVAWRAASRQERSKPLVAATIFALPVRPRPSRTPNDIRFPATQLRYTAWATHRYHGLTPNNSLYGAQ
jgi:transposase IS66 family protein